MTFKGFWLAGHPFQPFLLPIDVPATDPDENVDTTLTFNSDWAPVVLGALKVLLRPESWKGDDQTAIELATQRAQRLLDRFEDVDLSCPGFYLDLDDTCFSFDHSLVNFQAIDTGACDGQERDYEAVCGTSVLQATSKVSLRLFDIDDDTPVGGFIEELFVDNADPLAATPVFNLFWRDCLGVDQSETHAGVSFIKRGFDAQWLCVEGLYEMSVNVSVSGPVLCSPA